MMEHSDQKIGKIFITFAGICIIALVFILLSTLAFEPDESQAAPPPIPHDLQMRGNCIACHVGPGTVAAIRVEHTLWGDCRQCHVPDTLAAPFRR